MEGPQREGQHLTLDCSVISWEVNDSQPSKDMKGAIWSKQKWDKAWTNPQDGIHIWNCSGSHDPKTKYARTLKKTKYYCFSKGTKQ